jgi:aryl-alcohol dehydrogenase-like predicted oxidoreductase
VTKTSHQPDGAICDSNGAKLPQRRLGRSEIIVPAVALGGVAIGGRHVDVSEQEAIETVQYAVSQGINYIDTSPHYGESERRIGIALEGISRDTVIISTKTGTHPTLRGDYSWDATMWSVENSLRTLRTDRIDLLLVHDPDRFSPEGLAPILAPDGALGALEHLKEQGTIKAIGLGQRRHDFHRQAIESGRFDVILTYNDYHPLNVSAGNYLLPLAAQCDVGVLNGSPLAHGLLTGKEPGQVDPRLLRFSSPGAIDAARRFFQWCQARGVSMFQVVFQFCLRQPLIHCTLVGAKTPAELEENLQAATTPLPETIWEDLALLNLTAWRAAEE